MQAIWGVTDHLRRIHTGDYGKELQCGGVRVMWGVMDRLCHICMGNYGEESHWVVQGHRGDMACRRLLTRGLGNV